MKHFITDNIILVLFALLAAAGCTREELAPAPAGDFVAPSEFEIGWEYGDVVNIDTRTEQSVTVENRVTNLYVLLAAAKGEIIHRKSYWVTRDSQIPDGYDNIITAYSEKVSADGEASRGTRRTAKRHGEPYLHFSPEQAIASISTCFRTETAPRSPSMR